MNYFYDFETTNLNIFSAEIITGFILGDNESELEVKIRPNCWFENAVKIHGISRTDTLFFDDKIKGLMKIVEFMKNNKGTYWCFANENNFGSKYQYDYALLKNEMFRLQLETGSRYYYRFIELFENSCEYEFKSVHTLAKEKLKGQLKNFALQSLCNFFNIEYFNGHNAKADVLMTKNVYENLIKLI